MPRHIEIPVTLYRSQTGLTLAAQPKQADGTTDAGAAITSGFVEKGGGVYWWAGDVPDDAAGIDWLNASDGDAYLYTDALPPTVVTRDDEDWVKLCAVVFRGDYVASYTADSGEVVITTAAGDITHGLTIDSQRRITVREVTEA